MKDLFKIVFVLFLYNTVQAQTFPIVTNIVRDVTAISPLISSSSSSVQTVTTNDSAHVRLDFTTANISTNYLLIIQIGTAQDSTNACARIFKFVTVNSALTIVPNDNLPQVPYYLKPGRLGIYLQIPLSNYSNIKWLTVFTTDITTSLSSTKSYYQFN